MDERLKLEEEDILLLLKEKKFVELKAYLCEINVVDIAEILDDLDTKTSLMVIRMLPKDLVVEVFAYLDIEKQTELASLITDVELKYLMEEMYFDDLIDLLEEMPAEFVSKVLKNAPYEERKRINQFLNYPEDSAGSIMTIEYVELKVRMTVQDALDYIRETGLNKETVYTCYVTNENEKLEGIVSLRTLVISDPTQTIGDIMETDIISVNTNDDQEDVAETFKKYDFLALPVVDTSYRLTGIITVDDIMDVIEEEATEDFQKMAGITALESEYLDLDILTLAKMRIGWLLILMISGTFTGFIIRQYEDLLTHVTILTMFFPMLMDTGGNAGSQSSTMVIRGLAVGDIKMTDAVKVFFKEFSISILVGTMLSAVNFVRLMWINKVGLAISLTVSLTLIFTVIMAKLIGGMLPIMAKKLNLDPAIMAGPVITTIVDAMSLVIYFQFATFLLEMV